MAKKPGRPKIQDKRITIAVRVTPAVAAELKKIAKNEERSVSQVVDRALRDYLNLK